MTVRPLALTTTMGSTPRATAGRRNWAYCWRVSMRVLVCHGKRRFPLACCRHRTEEWKDGERSPQKTPGNRGPETPMRLLSYNIHKGIGGRDRRYDLERVWQVIREEDPDLICLQEVTQNARRTHHHDQPLVLA